jgi:phosphonopyruvate decarboxylase
MQNSGLGRAVNPLTSLVDPEVFSIPVLLMIGWRGEPGKKDEPEHKKMGRIMLRLLDTLEIPYSVLTDNLKSIKNEIAKARDYMTKNNAPYVMVIRKGLLEDYEQKKSQNENFEMNREDAIKIIIDNLGDSEVIVSTIGKTSRELFEYRSAKGENHKRDFYTVGSMGCSAAIAMSIAMKIQDKKVFVLDGDGSLLMQMGTIATIGHYSPKNLCHIILDNQSHDSTGGQPTVSETVNFEKVAISCGYRHANTVKNKKDLTEKFRGILKMEGPQMLVVKIKKGSRKDLGRPTISPIENKKRFMGYIKR